MVITPFHTQHVLKAYSQQLAIRSRVSKDKAPPSGQRDNVTISFESKKKLLADKITQEIVNQLTTGSEHSQTTRKILDRLNQEFGQPLNISSPDGKEIIFEVLEGPDGQAARNLSEEESGGLKRKLFDITKSMVYDGLLLREDTHET